MDRRPLDRRGMKPGSGLLGGCVFLHVAEEQEGGFRMPHREVYVLGILDNVVRGPASRVANVSEGDLDGVGSGGSSFA